MRLTFPRTAATFLSLAVLCAAAPGCGGSSEIEKPAPTTDLKPDMNRMPGFNEMQDQLKAKKGGAKKAPGTAPAPTPAK